jgi:chromosome segregation ATPase
MLLLPGVPWRDDTRVAQLLSGIEYPDSRPSTSRRNLVILLERLVQARRDDHRKCEQRLDGLRDERRKLEQKLDSTREECKRADMLQQKLDELRDIDRDLRSKRPSRRTKP